MAGLPHHGLSYPALSSTAILHLYQRAEVYRLKDLQCSIQSLGEERLRPAQQQAEGSQSADVLQSPDLIASTMGFPPG